MGYVRSCPVGNQVITFTIVYPFALNFPLRTDSESRWQHGKLEMARLSPRFSQLKIEEMGRTSMSYSGSDMVFSQLNIAVNFDIESKYFMSGVPKFEDRATAYSVCATARIRS